MMAFLKKHGGLIAFSAVAILFAINSIKSAPKNINIYYLFGIMAVILAIAAVLIAKKFRAKAGSGLAAAINSAAWFLVPFAFAPVWYNGLIMNQMLLFIALIIFCVWTFGFSPMSDKIPTGFFATINIMIIIGMIVVMVVNHQWGDQIKNYQRQPKQTKQTIYQPPQPKVIYEPSAVAGCKVQQNSTNVYFIDLEPGKIANTGIRIADNTKWLAIRITGSKYFLENGSPNNFVPIPEKNLDWTSRKGSWLNLKGGKTKTKIKIIIT